MFNYLALHSTFQEQALDQEMLEASAQQQFNEAAALVSSELQEAKKVLLIYHMLLSFFIAGKPRLKDFP